MNHYIVTVRYRTNSGCNAKTHEIEAADMTTAIQIACDRQRKRRGVIRIDGGDCVEDQSNQWTGTTIWSDVVAP